MLGAKRRLGQSTDCPAQSMDLRFARQSTDCLLNPWIARIKGLKAWIWSNHGFELEDTCMPNYPSLLQYHAWIQLPPNHKIHAGIEISSIRNWSYTVVLVHSAACSQTNYIIINSCSTDALLILKPIKSRKNLFFLCCWIFFWHRARIITCSQRMHIISN